MLHCLSLQGGGQQALSNLGGGGSGTDAGSRGAWQVGCSQGWLQCLLLARCMSSGLWVLYLLSSTGCGLRAETD
jgi:hypothetical protein